MAGEVGLDLGGLDQRLPLAQADGHHHDPPVVGGHEVTTEGAVHVVADGRSVLVEHLGLGHVAEVGHHGEGHVGQRDR